MIRARKTKNPQEQNEPRGTQYLPEILGDEDRGCVIGKKYRQFESLDVFLNEINEYIDNKLSDNKLEKLESSIRKGLYLSKKMFGDYAFRKWPAGYSYKYPINKALFETWTVLLSEYSWEDIKPHKNEMIKRFRNECNMEYTSFYAAIYRSAAKPKNVQLRFETINKIIRLEG